MVCIPSFNRTKDDGRMTTAVLYNFVRLQSLVIRPFEELR